MNTTQQTLDLIKGIQSKGTDEALAKSITQATGLVAFDLQAPAKNLYPVLTPFRNKMPRVPGSGGTATNWRQVSAIIGSGYDAMGWVPEGQRSGRMSYTTANKAASYVTIGEEDQISFEAIGAGRTFEDVRATMSMRLLQKMMLKEEKAIKGGNSSVALGTPVAPTVSASGSGATLAAATYVVYAVALTFEGYLNSSVAGGVALSQVVTGADGGTYTVKGGSSNKSAASAGQAVTLGQTLFASTTAIRGAVAYAWYVGVSGSEKLEKITTINSAAFTTPLIGGAQQAATAVVADNSQNTTLGFDGLMYAAFAAASGAYFNSLATGTSGTGTPLTTSGRGSVNEIDQMLKTMWDTFRVSPTALYVNSQEQLNITNKVLSNASGPLLRYNTDGANPYAIVANGVVEYYYNPFSAGAGFKMPVVLDPDVPAGTILAWCENLPAQYQSNNVPNVAEVHVRQDYYEIEWPLRTRQREHGVYVEEVLAVYAPFALGIITNIGNG